MKIFVFFLLFCTIRPIFGQDYKPLPESKELGLLSKIFGHIEVDSEARRSAAEGYISQNLKNASALKLPKSPKVNRISMVAWTDEAKSSVKKVVNIEDVDGDGAISNAAIITPFDAKPVSLFFFVTPLQGQNGDERGALTVRLVSQRVKAGDQTTILHRDSFPSFRWNQKVRNKVYDDWHSSSKHNSMFGGFFHFRLNRDFHTSESRDTYRFSTVAQKNSVPERTFRTSYNIRFERIGKGIWLEVNLPKKADYQKIQVDAKVLYSNDAFTLAENVVLKKR